MNLTDEEIEKYALDEASTLYWADFHDGINYKHGIIKGAKFARDHSPKFKTLEEIGWRKGRNLVVETALGSWIIYDEPEGVSLSFHEWKKTGFKTRKAKSVEHSKQLAQSDYENKLKALLK